MKKILMIVYNDLSRDARVQRAAEALSSTYEVTVLSCGFSAYQSEFFHNIEFEIKESSSVKRYYTFINKVLKFAKKMHYDIIYAHDFYTALPLLLLKKWKTKIKFIYDAHELYLKNDRFSKRDKFFYFFEKKAIRSADLVICAQEKRSELMREHYKLDKFPTVIRNISYLPYAAVTVENTKEITLARFYEIDAFCIVYAGAIVPGRNIKDLIKAVNDLGNNYKLLIIGSGSYLKTVTEIIDKYDNGNILLIGSVPYRSLAYYLKHCDVGYLYYSEVGLNNLYCAPNKIYEYAGAGLTIIANENQTVKTILETNGIGIARNNVGEAIKEIEACINDYRQNLEVFVSNNKWEPEAYKLLMCVDSLF